MRVPVRELAKMQFLGVARSSAPAVHDIAEEIAAKAGVTFKATLMAENVLMSLSEVAAGMGFCLLPEYVRQILPPEVVARNLDCNPEPELPLLIVYRKDDRLPAVAFFRSLLKEQLSQ
jgi:DNA-binding transcriptional LysR family regulator